MAGEVSLRNRLGAIVLLVWISQLADARDDRWEALNHVTWHRTYTLVDREGKCNTGDIVAITEQSITLKCLDWSTGKSPTTSTVTIERQKVLRITDGPKVVDVIYTGKSSWADVEAMQHIGSSEAVLLITNDGRRHWGKLVRVADDGVKLKHWTKTTQIHKGDISQVYYVREKTLSDGAEYSAREMVFLDPRLWPYLLHIPPKVSVLLYDSSLPEDNSHVKCGDAP